MNAGGVFIIVFVVVGFAGIVWLVVSKDRERRRARAQRAAERGWTYAPGGRTGLAYTVRGSEGGEAWTLEVLQGGKNKPRRSSWRCPGVPLRDGVVYVGPKMALSMLKSPLGTKLARWGLQMVHDGGDIGAVWKRLLDGWQEYDTGDPGFAADHAVLATDPGPARRLLTGDACRAMLEWEGAHKLGWASQGHINVAWSEAGLTVAWEGMNISKPDDMVKFVELAVRLLAPCREGW